VGYRQWWFPAAGLLIVVVGIGQLLYRRFYPAASRWRRVLPYIYTCLAIAWTGVAFAVTYGDYRDTVKRLGDGRYTTVEGPVTAFKPMPREGHADESFAVHGRLYRYSDYRVSACFNNTQSHGGPIRQGLVVRIADINGCIARLEVCR
jgi:hypothetical protein